MIDYVKNYWPIFSSIGIVVISLAMQWAVFGTRLTNVESRQDRQSTAIMLLQTQQATEAQNSAALQAKVDAIGDNVNYIRSRIDSVTVLSK